MRGDSQLTLCGRSPRPTDPRTINFVRGQLTDCIRGCLSSQAAPPTPHNVRRTRTLRALDAQLSREPPEPQTWVRRTRTLRALSSQLSREPSEPQTWVRFPSDTSLADLFAFSVAFWVSLAARVLALTICVCVSPERVPSLPAAIADLSPSLAARSAHSLFSLARFFHLNIR